ncbi:MAG: preprotein translocase subunit SecG [Alphaproteobacteria bacterium]|nr:preprotein translocase subunit SecG [Alphaproteobacteria bacterium]
MEAVLLVIHLIVAVAIIAVVMLQPAEAGGFVGGGGSASNMMMPRRSADFMTRLTTGLAGCFFLTSLLLAIVSSHRPETKSILEMAAESPAAASVKGTQETAPVKKETAPKAPIAE